MCGPLPPARPGKASDSLFVASSIVRRDAAIVEPAQGGAAKQRTVLRRGAKPPQRRPTGRFARVPPASSTVLRSGARYRCGIGRTPRGAVFAGTSRRPGSRLRMRKSATTAAGHLHSRSRALPWYRTDCCLDGQRLNRAWNRIRLIHDGRTLRVVEVSRRRRRRRLGAGRPRTCPHERLARRAPSQDVACLRARDGQVAAPGGSCSSHAPNCPGVPIASPGYLAMRDGHVAPRTGETDRRDARSLAAGTSEKQRLRRGHRGAARTSCSTRTQRGSR